MLANSLLVPEGSPTITNSAGTQRWAGFLVRDHAHSPMPGDTATLQRRRHTLSDKLIVVLDDCIERNWIHAAHRRFFQLPYRQIDLDTQETSFCRHWVNIFSPPDDYVSAVPLFRHLATLANNTWGENAVLKRMDAYSTTHGDMPLLHRDLESGRGLTAVFYGNALWDPAWTSETGVLRRCGGAQNIGSTTPRQARHI